MDISDALEGYWLTRSIDLSPNTIRGYKLIFKRLTEFTGNIQIEEINANTIRRFLLYLPDQFDMGDRSVSNAWVALSSLWTWAEGELSIPHVIRDKVKQPKFIDIVPDAFTEEEIKAILKATKFTKEWDSRRGRHAHSRRPTASRDEAIILTLVDTGLRSGELCALTIGDYDKARMRLHVRQGKGKKSRYIGLGNRASKGIWLYMTRRGKVKPSDPLFASKTDRFMDKDNLRHTLDIIGKNANVESVYPHRFRHTFAIEFLRNGGDVMLLKELLGHSSLDMVMRYAKIVDQDITRAVRHSPADNWRL